MQRQPKQRDSSVQPAQHQRHRSQQQRPPRQHRQPLDPVRAAHIARNRSILAAPSAQAVLDYALANCAQFDHVSTATAVHRLATLAAQQPAEVFRHAAWTLLLQRLAAQAHELQPRGVGNVVWGLAALGAEAKPALLQSLAARFHRQLSACTAQNISNSALGFAQLGVDLSSELWDRAVQLMLDLEHNANGQDVANLLTACAQARHDPGQKAMRLLTDWLLLSHSVALVCNW